MSRLSPKTDVLRALFARSGNCCAFPGCTSLLINERHQFIAQVCHIEAAEIGGERFNRYQTDEQRRQYDNLLILCYPHHIETNDVASYPAQKMFEIKAAHEKRFEKKPFKIDEIILSKITLEMDLYWSQIDALHKTDLAKNTYVKDSFPALIEHARSLAANVLELRDILLQSNNALDQEFATFVNKLSIPDSILEKYSERTSPFGTQNWEILNIYLTNTVSMLHVALSQIEIMYQEQFVKVNLDDSSALLRLEKLKIEFENLVTSAEYVD